jgi:hypothetical protein
MATTQKRTALGPKGYFNIFEDGIIYGYLMALTSEAGITYLERTYCQVHVLAEGNTL